MSFSKNVIVCHAHYIIINVDNIVNNRIYNIAKHSTSLHMDFLLYLNLANRTDFTRPIEGKLESFEKHGGCFFQFHAFGV